ncbi:MAG TPA: PLP-dependent aminotransferase family protein [Aeromicrobium sp.]|nr:PLP-dependent aminotransferase family protein [Aeromicrobium sp.]
MTISASRLATLVGDEPLRSPAYRDLADRLRVLVVDGRLPDGTRLPSERELAAVLGVSRTTTTRVYAELRDAGLVASRQGSGSVVQVPFKASTVSSLILDPDSPDDIAMTYSAPSAPIGLASVFTAAAERLPSLLSTTGYLPDGLRELREAIAEHHTADGLPTTPDQIIVTAGAMGAINLTAQTFLSPGSRVFVEGVSFPHAHDALLAAGARLSPLPLADDPWDSAALKTLLGRSQHAAAYVIPDFHNPTGAVMTDSDRGAWATLLKRHDVLPLVDETLRYVNLDDVELPPPFATYDPRAITFGSLSKAFWGGMRIGWARVPQARRMAMLQSRMFIDLGASAFDQLVAADLLRSGHELAHARLVEARQARDHLIAALSRAVPTVRTTRPAGGLNLWLTFPEPVTTRLVAAASQRGLLLTPGARFFVQSGGERNLRLPYTQPTDVLTDAVDRLAAACGEIHANDEPRRTGSTLDLIA